MISAENREQIYQAQQRDNWEFKKDASGYFWVRTSGKQVVGTSHRAFTKLDDCEANAKMVGYNNSFTVPRGSVWEFYQDNKKAYRWRLLDEKGVVLNRAHEGFKTAEAAEKNAVRHGHGLVSSVSASSTSGWPTMPAEPCCELSNWGKYVLFLLFVIVAGTAWAGLPSVAPATPDEKEPSMQLPEEATFIDVPLDAPEAACVYHLAERDILNGYKHADGTLTGVYGVGDTVSKNQLAKAVQAATDDGVFSCAPTSQEPVGGDWAMPYVRCAVAKEWRAYPSTEHDYNSAATMADAAVTLLDGFKLTEQQAAEQSLLRSLGEFEPEELITRVQLAELLCAFGA